MSNTKKVRNNKTNRVNKSKLNLNVINSANSKFTTKTILVPVDGVDYEVKIDQIFRTSKIEKMVMDFLNTENITKNLDTLDETVKLSFLMYLIIKNFTNLDIPNNLKFEEEVNLISSLIDLGIFEVIISQIPESEITKVNEFMQKFNMNLNKVMEEENVNINISDDEVNENAIVTDGEGGQVG